MIADLCLPKEYANTAESAIFLFRGLLLLLLAVSIAENKFVR